MSGEGRWAYLGSKTGKGVGVVARSSATSSRISVRVDLR